MIYWFGFIYQFKSKVPSNTHPRTKKSCVAYISALRLRLAAAETSADPRAWGDGDPWDLPRDLCRDLSRDPWDLSRDLFRNLSRDLPGLSFYVTCLGTSLVCRSMGPV